MTNNLDLLLEPTAPMQPDEVRLGIVRELAGGTAPNLEMLAKRLGRDSDLVSKHLRVLCEARVIEPVRPPDTDGRQQFYPELRDWRYPIRHDHWATGLPAPRGSILLIQPQRIEKPRDSKHHDD